MTLLEILEKRRRDALKPVSEEEKSPSVDVTKVEGYFPPTNVRFPSWGISPELDAFYALFADCTDY